VQLDQLVLGAGEADLQSFNVVQPAFWLGLGDPGAQLSRISCTSPGAVPRRHAPAIPRRYLPRPAVPRHGYSSATNQVWGLTKTDQDWSEELEAALTATRRADLKRGTSAA
jgi:hypothetical protein